MRRCIPLLATVLVSCSTRGSQTSTATPDEARLAEIEAANEARLRGEAAEAARLEEQEAADAKAAEELRQQEDELVRKAQAEAASRRWEEYEAEQARLRELDAMRERAKQAARDRQAAHEAWVQAEAKTAPPWHCWTASFVFDDGTVTEDGACFASKKKCDMSRKRVKTGQCEKQPLAACFFARNALKGGSWWCAPSFEMCKATRWSVTGGGVVSADWPEVRECEPLPTSAFK